MDFPTHDILKRRLRYRRTPLPNRTEIQSRDIEVFKKLNVHGILNRYYLFRLTKEHGTNEQYFTKRLTVLFHQGYLKRIGSMNMNLISYYALDDKAIAVLQQYEEYHPISAGGWSNHNAAAGAITGSIEVACETAGFRFIPWHEIAPKLTYKFKNEKLGTLTPDALFGIDYKGTQRYYALEADLATEDLATISGKFVKYRQLIDHEKYKDGYRIPNLKVIFITTLERRKDNFLTKLLALDKQGCDYMLFSTMPYFYNTSTFDDPRMEKLALDVPVMEDFLTRPYQRAGRSDFFIDNPARQ